MDLEKLYLIRTQLVKDEPLEFKIIKSLEAIFSEYNKSKVAVVEVEEQEIFIPFLPEREAMKLIQTFRSVRIILVGLLILLQRSIFQEECYTDT